jgi:hypothetical protein
MLIVNQYNVIPIKEKNKKAQLDSLELSSSKVPYIRINRDAPARDPYTGFLYAGAPVPQSIEGKDFKEIKIEIGYFDIETQVLQPNEYNQYCIFRNMKCWHYIDGQYRVGRDDYEWDEDTYAIPVLGGCKISEKVLDAINRELKINFQYQEESQRYYFRVCGESETIAGMAKRRGGEISNENTISQILKIMLAEGV